MLRLSVLVLCRMMVDVDAVGGDGVVIVAVRRCCRLLCCVSSMLSLRWWL